MIFRRRCEYENIEETERYIKNKNYGGNILEKKIPSYHTLVKDALICLLSIGGKATNKEILEAVMRKLDVNEILREKLNYNLGWAKVYAKKYGLISSEAGRSIWKINKEISNIKITDVEMIVKQKKKLYYSNR